MMYTALFIHRQTKRRAVSGTVNAETAETIYRAAAGIPETVHVQCVKKDARMNSS